MTRYNEQSTRTSSVGTPQGFVMRRRHGSPLRIALMYTLLIIAIIALMLTEQSAGMGWMHMAVILLVGVLVIHALYLVQRNLDVVADVEMQNALFAGAIAQSGEFVIILREDGHMAYADDGFRKYFPGFPIGAHPDIQQIIDAMQLSRTDGGRLYESLKRKHGAHFLFPLTQSSGQTQTMRLSVMPLDRPNGFFLLRGRRYVTQREQDWHSPQLPTPSGMWTRHAELALMELPQACYVASPSGYVRYANPAFLNLLGYTRDDIEKAGVLLDDILYQTDENKTITEDGQTPHSLLQQTFQGVCALSRKNGSLLKVALDQGVRCDTDGTVIAHIGFFSRQHASYEEDVCSVD